MSNPPTGPITGPTWCSDGNTYTPVTLPDGYSCIGDQRADHQALVAALMAAHPENC